MYDKRLYIGIDVGDKGGCSFFYNKEKNPVYYIDFRKLGTIKNFKKKLIPFIENYNDIYACIEKVHSMPGNGSSSSFKFGASSAWAECVIDMLNIPYTLVTPQAWKKYFNCIINKSDHLDKTNLQLKPLKKLIVQKRAFDIMDKNYILENYCQKSKKGEFKKDIEFYDAIMIGKYCQLTCSEESLDK